MRSRPTIVKSFLFGSGPIVCVAATSLFAPVRSQDLGQLLDQPNGAEQSGTLRPGLRKASDRSPDDTEAEKSRPQVPSPEEQRASAAKIRDIYGKEAASAATPAQKARLAKQLLEQSTADGNAADRYMLLETASRLAIEAGDPDVLSECRSAMSTQFVTDASAIRASDAESLASKAPVEMLASVVRFILESSEQELAAARFDAAEAMAKVAATAARKARDPALTKTVTTRLAEIRSRKKQEADLKPLLDRLNANANDQDAAKQVGMIRCFTQARWPEGLPLLAKADDPDLARICAMELRQADGNLVAAADAWWAYADNRKPTQKDAIRRHAADLYEAALPNLTGLDRVRVEKRLQEAALGTASGEQAVFFADLKETVVTGAKYGFSTDGSYMGKPFTCMNEKWPKAISAIGDGSAPAVVEYLLPTTASRVQGRVGVFSPSEAKPDQQPGGPIVFEVVADGRVVWTSAPMTKRDAAQPFRVNIRGATTIELRTQTKSGYCAWGAWLNPQVVR